MTGLHTIARQQTAAFLLCSLQTDTIENAGKQILEVRADLSEGSI